MTDREMALWRVQRRTELLMRLVVRDSPQVLVDRAREMLREAMRKLDGTS